MAYFLKILYFNYQLNIIKKMFIYRNKSASLNCCWIEHQFSPLKKHFKKIKNYLILTNSYIKRKDFVLKFVALWSSSFAEFLHGHHLSFQNTKIIFQSVWLHQPRITFLVVIIYHHVVRFQNFSFCLFLSVVHIISLIRVTSYICMNIFESLASEQTKPLLGKAVRAPGSLNSVVLVSSTFVNCLVVVGCIQCVDFSSVIDK